MANESQLSEFDGSYSLRTRGPAIFARFEGRVGGALVERSLAELRSILQSRTAYRFFVIDGTGIIDYDLTVRGPGRKLIGEFKELGGERVLFVLNSRMQRLLASTLSLALGMSTKIFESEAELEDYLRAEL